MRPAPGNADLFLSKSSLWPRAASTQKRDSCKRDDGNTGIEPGAEATTGEGHPHGADARDETPTMSIEGTALKRTIVGEKSFIFGSGTPDRKLETRYHVFSPCSFNFDALHGCCADY
jgi:hypothetical protein